MFSEQHTLTLTKPLQRRRTSGHDKDMANLVESVNSRSQEVGGWVVTAGGWTEQESDQPGMAVEYTMTLLVDYNKAVEADGETLKQIVRKTASRAPTPKFGRWTLTAVDGELYEPKAASDTDKDTEDVGYAPCAIPEDFESYFSHLYGLDDQVMLMRSQLESAIDSGWIHRSNMVLWGGPGCGKSESALAVKAALGDEAVWSLDGTSMTQAGVQKMFTEAEILPRVVVIEEIEKAAEDPLRFLLAMCDTRGQVRKVTARANIERETKVLVIATVNDKAKFDRMLASALSDRFTAPIHFDPPTRETLAMILRRELDKVGGDYAWIGPTLDFCEEEGISQPRRIIAICTGGKSRLLNGSYQRALRNTAGPKVS